MLTVVRHCYAIFMQHMPCFCKRKKHWSGWFGMFSIYLLYFTESLDDGRMSACFLHSGKKHMLFIKSVFGCFYFKAYLLQN